MSMASENILRDIREELKKHNALLKEQNRLLLKLIQQKGDENAKPNT